LSAVRAWERQQEENRPRTARGFQNEHEYDERKAFLFKELRHRLEKGDYRVIEDMLAQLLLSNTAAVQLPSISIPSEFPEVVKQLALSEQEQLSKLTDQTASARQVLSDYVYKIVADEKIEPEKVSK